MTTSKTTKAEEEMNAVFDCDNDLLSYVIKPQTTVKMVGKNDVTTSTDFEKLF